MNETSSWRSIIISVSISRTSRLNGAAMYLKTKLGISKS